MDNWKVEQANNDESAEKKQEKVVVLGVGEGWLEVWD